ncbi:transcription termination protein NusA [Cutibacterium acnes JCM 18918]|nr:transcription termination protein NusA [Cutibacterium acnes JCM 18918]
MDIDLSTLRMIERDKDIPLDYLLTTLEDALLNAYDKTEAPVNGAKVQLDRKTGNVAVMLPEKDEEGQVVGWYDGTPEDFGRVAASTARQVIFQRLREAEDEQKYGHFFPPLRVTSSPESSSSLTAIPGPFASTWAHWRALCLRRNRFPGRNIPMGVVSVCTSWPCARKPVARRSLSRALTRTWCASFFCYGGTRDRAGGRRDQGAGS